MILKRLSLHPKFAGVVDVAVGGLFLWSLHQTLIWWLLLVFLAARLLWWAFILKITYYPIYIRRLWHFLALAFFQIGLFFLLLFIEWKTAWWLVSIVYLLFPLISFWFLPAKNDNQLSFVTKTYRRLRFWMCAFGLFGIWSGIFAAVSLQIFNLNYWFILLPAVLVTAALNAWWWHEYNITIDKKYYFWVATSGLATLELAWALFQWPLGYFATALILTWLWYDFWLMARFHLLPLGINWKKQRAFFIVNGILLAVYLLFIVKWK